VTAREAVGLGVAVAACLAAGAIGSLATAGAVPTWYATLRLPAWRPPNWVFAPVWTTLYVMMGVAAWLVWRAGGWHAHRLALGLFVAQLVLNLSWSLIFFGLHRIGWACVEIVALWVAIAATLAAFWPIRPLAGILLLPYLAWVTFAAVLNLAIWRLNRG
jgi:benzodiazapine receptor